MSHYFENDMNLKSEIRELKYIKKGAKRDGEFWHFKNFFRLTPKFDKIINSNMI